MLLFMSKITNNQDNPMIKHYVQVQSYILLAFLLGENPIYLDEFQLYHLHSLLGVEKLCIM